MPELTEVRIHKSNGRPYIFEYCGGEKRVWCDLKKFVWGRARTTKKASLKELGGHLSPATQKKLIREAQKSEEDEDNDRKSKRKSKSKSRSKRKALGKVHGSYKNGEDIYKDKRGFYIIQWNAKDHKEVKKYLKSLANVVKRSRSRSRSRR